MSLPADLLETRPAISALFDWTRRVTMMQGKCASLQLLAQALSIDSQSHVAELLVHAAGAYFLGAVPASTRRTAANGQSPYPCCP